ncbi:LexA family transcriptional regulator [Flavobacterium sp. AC]|uniref:LexA family transcriptional regulator n=1 Tax=Flavobacterium azizsancarii TaxID=2961580 RepID=A0ABT4WHM6_9FLAO|nr:XRE family transcriptional regulator [Flavobacterium azizsancarii]MDA6072051.1 LexA family transcriptional regulator [Flavobacterium azizsancarii]
MTKIERVKKLSKWLIFDGFADNDADLAKKLGYSKSSFSQIINEKVPLSTKFIETLCNANENINKVWITDLKGTMLKSTSNLLSNREDKKLIPFYDGVVTAGMQEIAIMDATQHQPAEMIDAGDWFRDATAAMRVHGDSMYPEYKSGSIAALREVKNKRLVVYGQDYLIETTEYRVIKRLQKSDIPQNWLACSVNEEKYESSGRLIHEPFDVHIDDVTRLYQVLGNVKRNQSTTVIHTNRT